MTFVAGVAAAAVLLVGQLCLKQGEVLESPRLVQRASALSPPWPEVAAVAAGVEASFGLDGNQRHRGATLELAHRAARRDPADPAPWAELGLIELAWGSDGGAADAFRRSLDRNPWGVEALQGSVTLAPAPGRPGSLRRELSPPRGPQPGECRVPRGPALTGSSPGIDQEERRNGRWLSSPTWC